MNSKPVRIVRIIRRLRGGSQSQLVQGANGKFYVAKFLGNPQGNRTLINEWIASHLLRTLNISSPTVRILELPLTIQRADVSFTTGSVRNLPEGLLHLGSQCPVNPERTPIFDFLPDQLLANVVNLEEFATMFVFDQWIGQTDVRQAIFVRARRSIKSLAFDVHFVDHGMAFDGVHWQLRERLCGIPCQSTIANFINFKRLVERGVGLVERITETAIRESVEAIPPSWFAPGDREALNFLLDRLRSRQLQIEPLVARNVLHYMQINASIPSHRSTRAEPPYDAILEEL